MGKIDTSEWKEFRVGELFTQERGKEKAPKQNEPGDCPLIQETNNNNGFDRMVVPTKIIKGNSITVSINYAQNVFYQADDFCASVNIAVLRNNHLNRYNSQFVCSVLRNADLRLFEFARHYSTSSISTLGVAPYLPRRYPLRMFSVVRVEKSLMLYNSETPSSLFLSTK